MRPETAEGAWPLSAVIRRWAIRFGIALLAIEVLYVVAANAFLRTGLLLDLINKKPEKTSISWDSVVTYLPGVATVTNFELRSQTRKDQVYLRVAEADARISLVKLLAKTIHIRGVDASGADFRYRERLDRPPKENQDDEQGREPPNPEFWPDIPGYSNPPDPKPEDLYEIRKKKRPWTIKITGAEVEGPIKVALGEVRIEGDGWVGGGVTVKPRRTIRIHRGRLGLTSTRVTIGPDIVTSDLKIAADLDFDAFPAKGAKIADVLGGISGELSLAGQVGDRVAVRHVITPGISTFGAGIVDISMRLEDGVLRNGSEYSLQSDAFQVQIMGLDATGSATVEGHTKEEGREHVTTARIDLGDFKFVDPDDGSVDISGSGLTLDAVWHGLSIAGRVPATRAEVIVPSATIHDVSTFNAVIPEQENLVLVSGTGVVEARLVVNDQIADGTLDLVAEEIVLRSKEAPFRGDLEIHAKLARGDLPAKRFDFSGTTLLLDSVVDTSLSEKKQEKLDAWFCDLEVGEGELIIDKPLSINGDVRLKMHDSRPVIAVLKDLGAGPKWLSMAPNIKDIDGTMKVDIRKGALAFEDLDMTGDGFEALGWMSVEDKKADGRLFVRFKSVMAGVSLDQGKTKIQLSKPRQWFEDESGGLPADSAQAGDSAPEATEPVASKDGG
jgi:hypothetical protein